MAVYSSIVGLKDIHYAILTSDDSTGAVYATPKVLAPAKSVQVTTTTNSATQYADDGPVATASQIGSTEVQIGVTDIPMEVLAEILGQTVDANGVLNYDQTKVAPYLALGFRGTKENGKSRFVWLFKGRFQIPEENWQTKEDTPAFQEPTITGTFIRREYDKLFKVVGDEDVSGFNASATWFDAVYAG